MVKAPTRADKNNLLQLLDDPAIQEQLRQILQEKVGTGSHSDSTLSPDRPSQNSTEIAQLYKLVFEAIQQQSKAIEQQTRAYAQVGKAIGMIQGTAKAGREWSTVARDAQDVGRLILLGGAAITFTLFVFVLTMIQWH